MKRRSITMNGVTSADRHEVTAAVDKAILASEGWVVDHTLFSNIAITLRLSLPMGKLDDFKRRVAEAGVRLDDASQGSSCATTRDEDGETEITVSLNVTFIHDEPDLRRTVPAVPG